MERSDGSCAEYWYIRTKPVHDYAAASLVTMTLDTLLTLPSMFTLRAILKLEQNAEALIQVSKERSGLPLMGSAGTQ